MEWGEKCYSTHTYTLRMNSKRTHIPQNARAQNITKRSGDAERSFEGGFGGLPRPRFTQHSYAHKKAKRSGEAERSGNGGSGVSLDYEESTPATAK
jgi:hypothetical protein